jgi:phosphate starvation-inducible PhoH-like protein
VPRRARRPATSAGAQSLKTPTPLAELGTASHRIGFEDNATCALLFGQHHLNLARIEQKLPVSLVTRGNEVFIQGASDEDVHAAASVLESLYGQLRRGATVGRDEVDAALRMHGQGADRGGERLQVRTDRKQVVPRSANQAAYLRALESHELVLALGPAGTGKTYLAVAMAVAFLKQRRVERLILSRPAVEAGEKLGFLPGDMKEKVDPYLRPLYDALQDMLPEGKLAQRMEQGQIEIAPLAYMRGRTLSNAFVILDEAQNTTPAQMKMFLTRLGEGSRMVVTGDPTQTDLPPGAASGLADAVRRLEGVPAIGIVRFERGDIVRHPLVTDIIDAYDRTDRAEGRTRDVAAA